MCKFNNNLFAIYVLTFGLVITLIQSANGNPIDFLLFDDYDEEPAGQAQDYDLHYDQRQNGTGNFRLHIDGVVIGVPSSGGASDMVSSLANNYLLDLVASHKADTDALDGDNNDKYDENEDKPYEYENAGGGSTTGQEQAAAAAADQSDNFDSSITGDLNDFNKPVAVISSQKIVEIKPTTPDAGKGGTITTTEPDYDAKNVIEHQRRRPNKKGKNSPRRRNKLKFRLGSLLEYLTGGGQRQKQGI